MKHFSAPAIFLAALRRRTKQLSSGGRAENRDVTRNQDRGRRLLEHLGRPSLASDRLPTSFLIKVTIPCQRGLNQAAAVPPNMSSRSAWENLATIS